MFGTLVRYWQPFPLSQENSSAGKRSHPCPNSTVFLRKSVLSTQRHHDPGTCIPVYVLSSHQSVIATELTQSTYYCNVGPDYSVWRKKSISSPGCSILRFAFSAGGGFREIHCSVSHPTPAWRKRAKIAKAKRSHPSKTQRAKQSYV